jgi:hypothetical protein
MNFLKSNMTKSEQKKHDEILKICKIYKKIYKKIFNLFILCLQYTIDKVNKVNKKIEIIEEYIKENFNKYEKKYIYKYINILSFINYYSFYINDKKNFSINLNYIKCCMGYMGLSEKFIYCNDFKESGNEHEYIKNNNFYNNMIKDNENNFIKYLNEGPEQQQKIINTILNEARAKREAKRKNYIKYLNNNKIIII